MFTAFFVFIYMKQIINESIDLSEVGEICFEWDFDREEYEEWLTEGEIEDSQEALMEYINDNVTFEVDCKDVETYHSMGRPEWMSFEDLCENFGENGAEMILNQCRENNGSGRLETMELLDAEIDINNPLELNNQAKKLLPHGGYTKGCRGFILTDGTVVYTPSEHNEIQRISGIDSKFQFIRLGNIRIMPQSIDLAKEPTQEQWEVMRQVINSYSDQPFYIDIFDGNAEIGAMYGRGDWRYICGEINRWFKEGIRPQGRIRFESKNNVKNIIITESQYKRLFEAMLPSFSLKELDGIWDYEDKFEYCCEHLGKPIGEGSSRAVFQIDDNRVLKLAIDESGEAQNRVEAGDEIYKDELNIFPIMYTYDRECYTWVISEYVLPMEKEDVVKIFGINDVEFFHIIQALDRLVDKEKTGDISEREMGSIEYYSKCHPFLAGLVKCLRDEILLAGDLSNLGNFGITQRNGELIPVILDSGINMDVYKKYYDF